MITQLLIKSMQSCIINYTVDQFLNTEACTNPNPYPYILYYFQYFNKVYKLEK